MPNTRSDRRLAALRRYELTALPGLRNARLRDALRGFGSTATVLMAADSVLSNADIRQQMNASRTFREWFDDDSPEPERFATLEDALSDMSNWYEDSPHAHQDAADWIRENRP